MVGKDSESTISEDLQLQAGDRRDLKWVKVTEVDGPLQASLIVDYLRGEGVEAVAWQEAAGKALGLSGGVLGNTRIMVRQKDEILARSLLKADEEADEMGDWEEYRHGVSTYPSWIKAAMGAAALIISPIGAGIALGVSLLSRSKSRNQIGEPVICPECKASIEPDEALLARGWLECPECRCRISLTEVVFCPYCGSELELDAAKISRGWYRCPECQVTNVLSGHVICPHCQSTLELDSKEISQGWYCCPECDELVHLG